MATHVALERAPEPDEIELSIFGPGYGECVLLHLGGGAWVVVDSCVTGRDRQPAALEYLHSLGLTPDVVELIVATHWHDDHIRGLSSLVRECRNAQVVVSGAIAAREFLVVVKAHAMRPMVENSGVQEFFEIMNTMETRRSRPQFAVADKRIFQREVNLDGRGFRCEVFSLSPSDASIAAAYADIARLVPLPRSPKRRVTAPSPNRAAVVLWVEAGAVRMILGSDLEESATAGTGWSAIVESTTRPQAKAGAFKIPHHGAVSAHLDRVWSELLTKDPTAFLTPFRRGNVALPTEPDIRRIIGLCSNSYTTSHTPERKARRPRVVEQLVSAATRSMRPVGGSAGHVRLRQLQAGGGWRVELRNGAAPLRGSASAT